LPVSKALLKVLKPHVHLLPSFVRDQTGEAGMNGTPARQDGDTIPAKDRGRSAIHAALAQRHIPWTYAELAAVLADIRELQKIRHGDEVMIIGENGVPLLAIAEIDAWSVAVKPRLTAPEVDRLGEHGVARRIFLDEIPDTAHQYADIFVVPGPPMRDVEPLDRQAMPLRLKLDLRHAAEAV
jgi:hypothetical protein